MYMAALELSATSGGDRSPPRLALVAPRRRVEQRFHRDPTGLSARVPTVASSGSSSGG
jgi:hypothetical protein